MNNLLKLAVLAQFLDNGVFKPTPRRSTPIKRKTKEELYKDKGLKPFTINGVEVWALNIKNAERKYKKMTNK